MSIRAIDLRRGQAIVYKDGVWVCITNEKVAKGNWRSSQVIQLKNIKTGQLIQERFRTDEAFETAFIERKAMTYLYSDASNHVMMNMETFEEVRVPLDLIGDQSVYLVPNLQVTMGLQDGRPVTAELPNTVELVVQDTPPQLKGATATNSMKEAVCEGGARVKVPSFVANGAHILVDTRTGEYLSKA
jgi:elongation factor P